MNNPRLTVLLISGDDIATSRISDALAAAGDNTWHVVRARRLDAGVGELKKARIAAVMLDLFLSDSQGIETFETLFKAAPLVPILILTKPGSESISEEAKRLGAQDHILVEHAGGYWLPRILLSAIGSNAASETLFLEKERTQVILNAIGDAVLCTDACGNVSWLNTFAEAMTGWSRQEVTDRPLVEIFQVIDAATRDPAPDLMALVIQENRTMALGTNCVLVRRDGHEAAIEASTAPIHDREGKVTGAVIVFRGITESHAGKPTMAHRPGHDMLTDLPNRMLLSDRLENAISLGRRNGKQRAILSVDLNRFRQVNDSLGHPLGGKLLQSVAQRLVACVRSSDTVSRQGGDEFVILLSEIEYAEDAALCAERVLSTLSTSHSIAGKKLHPTACIGIAIYPGDGLDAQTLIQCAGAAMYHAKHKGHSNYQFFARDMNVLAVERQLLESNLRRALDRREFVLHYQPRINLDTGDMSGVEALIRWLHPERGLMPPALFMPIAEDCGLMVPIGKWVLHEACRQAQAWIDAGFAPQPVAVNISPVELQHPDFVKTVRAALKKTRLKSVFLELELAESVLMRDAESAACALRELKSLGLRLSIDNFGIGYANLSHLQQYPIDTLKIDQCLMREINGDSRNASLVSAIISIGKTLDQRVVAGGIETAQQLAFLRRQHCREGQGYHLGRPMSAGEFTTVLDHAKSVYPRFQLTREKAAARTALERPCLR